MTSLIVALIVLAVACSIAAGRRRRAERTLLVGASPLAAKIVTELAGRRGLHRLAGIVDDLVPPPESSFASLMRGPLARLGAIVDELRPDRIVLALADRRGRLPVQELLQARVRGIAVEEGVHFYERLTGKIAIEAMTPHDLFTSAGFRKRQIALALAHATSLIVALAALVVCFPLFALIALAIRVDSPGPVFFVQERVGLRGRVFRLLKFRTMRAADTETSAWARDNGHRITRLGARLRRYRLDELPQLLNVLRGELNLIGPRPHPVCNFELFMSSIPYYSLRAVVRPGLTGWAQVRQGYANSLEEETEKMRYDLFYIKHMSAWLDLRILARTVHVVVSGSGPAGEMAAGARRARPSRFAFPLRRILVRRTDGAPSHTWRLAK